MTPYQQFVVNRDAAITYSDSYVELRRLKGLGARGALSQPNQYLLWLPRAGVVGAIGALDQYIHQVLNDHIPRLLAGSSTGISDSLADLVLRVATMKNAKSVKDHIRFIQSGTGPQDLASEIKDRVLQFDSFQAPEKIVRAYRLLNIQDALQSAADVWQGPNSSRDAIADRLDKYVKRRNQIAHEGDLTTSFNPRPITPKYTSDCIDFVSILVGRLDALVY